jgi:hypothetical protein
MKTASQPYNRDGAFNIHLSKTFLVDNHSCFIGILCRQSFSFIVIGAALCSMRRLNYIRDRRCNYHQYAFVLYLCFEITDLLNKWCWLILQLNPFFLLLVFHFSLHDERERVLSPQGINATTTFWGRSSVLHKAQNPMWILVMEASIM